MFRGGDGPKYTPEKNPKEVEGKKDGQLNTLPQKFDGVKEKPPANRQDVPKERTQLEKKLPPPEQPQKRVSEQERKAPAPEKKDAIRKAKNPDLKQAPNKVEVNPKRINEGQAKFAKKSDIPRNTQSESQGVSNRLGNFKNKNAEVKKTPDAKQESIQEKKALTPADERKLDKDCAKIEKYQQNIDSAKDVKAEKAKTYTESYVEKLSKTEDKLKQSIEETKEKIGKLDKNDPANRQELDSLNKSLENRTKQLDAVQKASYEAKEYREGQKLDKNHGAYEERFKNAQDGNLSRKQKQEMLSPEYEKALNEHKETLEKRCEHLKGEIKEREQTGKIDSPEYHKLKTELYEREHQLGVTDMMLSDTKGFERSAALEDSKERLYANRGDSRSDKKHDLEKDRECVRNNYAVMEGLGRDRNDAIKERNEVYAELNDLVQTYETPDLMANKDYQRLSKEYSEKCDKVDSIDSQIRALDMYNERLVEINGTYIDGKDEFGNDIEKNRLSVKSERLQATDEQISDIANRVNECTNVKSGEKFGKEDCIETLSALEDAHRKALPALESHISDLDRDIKVAENYMRENPNDASMKPYKERLEAERADKVMQMESIVKDMTVSADSLKLEEGNKSISCAINSDGTYTLQQRWTNVNEKVTNHEGFQAKTQLYGNAYDRVSTLNFDANGDSISHDFSFKYKMLGVYSETKMGGEKLNIHNMFEAGILNLKAGTGWDKTKHGMRLHAEATGSLVEVSASTKLNALNKQIFSAEGSANLGKASAEAKFDHIMPVISASVDAGISASGSVSIGKAQIMSGAFNAWSHGFESKITPQDIIDGKFSENVFGVTHNDGTSSKFSVGDKISLYETETKNGETKSTVVLSKLDEVFGTANGLSQLSSQMWNAAEIKSEGILPDADKNDGKVVFKSVQSFENENPNSNSVDKTFGSTGSELSNKEIRVGFVASETDNVIGKEIESSAPQKRLEMGQIFLNTSNREGSATFNLNGEQLLDTMTSAKFTDKAKEIVTTAVYRSQTGMGLSKGEISQLNAVQLRLEKLGYKDEATAVANLSNPKMEALYDVYGERYIGSFGTGAPMDSNVDSKEYTTVVRALERNGVTYVPIEQYEGNRTDKEIIKQISGGDLTIGSCSSLAFAYAGNRAGYNVCDFRGNESQKYFSQLSSIDTISKLPGLKREIASGMDELACANQLLSKMDRGKEYYFATGQHAAVVRCCSKGYEYLELQSRYTWKNGWHQLNDAALKNRFNCDSSGIQEVTNYLIDIDSLAGNKEFLNVLGYLNTAQKEQQKGWFGNVK